MITIENEIRDEGYEYIACIDEVGRGCLAGDVVACAVIMPKDLLIEGVNDSKKLTPKKRDKLYDIIIEEAIAVGVGSVDNKTIDEINIKKSTFLAMKKAIENLKDKDGNTVKPDFLLIDAEKLDVRLPQKSVIKGDEKCHGIAAASIIAKVYRDRQCIKWAKDYDGYGFERNKGYGTKEHREALLEKGPSPIHRMTFLTKILSKNKQISFLK
ncbi:ribonuclease HII [Sporosalibacterium faouarense]|uniref:ribonuclease HII n=1 Tax=Sporosalibacterium faouarense TaxID=516123 RepID=UPI00192B42F1|nr:ribonuclease HII [Sporosalibacterium faouarense]